MKVLQKILFFFALTVGLSVSIFAQKNDDPKRTPPKGKPPVVTPGDKKPPKNDDKHKKQMAEVVIDPKTFADRS
jgi:hypothetical protein